jgi:hypothetical protein
MSSLNPFAARRERKEEQMKAKLEEVQRQQGGGGGRALQPGELSGATASSISTLQLPEQSYDTEDLDKYLPASAKVDQAAPTFKVPSGGNYGYEAPSRFRQCGYKLQNGFMIGASLGGAVGFLYGTWAAISYKHILYLPIAVLQSGGFFGLFLACGTVIRCEETGQVAALRDARWQIQQQQQQQQRSGNIIDLDALGAEFRESRLRSDGLVAAVRAPSSAPSAAGRKSAIVAAVLAD